MFSWGSIDFLQSELPAQHLTITGEASPTFIVVWFLIALWTFADPGFHQRCYSARTPKIAKFGIIISIFFWALFDFLTTTTGLYSRALIPEIDNPVLSFPILAEKILGTGFKGIFYAALIATILSTLNSFLFLSATVNEPCPGPKGRQLPSIAPIRHSGPCSRNSTRSCGCAPA